MFEFTAKKCAKKFSHHLYQIESNALNFFWIAFYTRCTHTIQYVQKNIFKKALQNLKCNSNYFHSEFARNRIPLCGFVNELYIILSPFSMGKTFLFIWKCFIKASCNIKAHKYTQKNSLQTMMHMNTLICLFIRIMNIM